MTMTGIKKIWDKTKNWIFGGGMIAIVSASIAYGVSKENTRSRLDKNDADHVTVNYKLDKQDEKLDDIDRRTIRIETKLEAAINNATYGEGVAKKN